jgi:hypothetical protein
MLIVVAIFNVDRHAPFAQLALRGHYTHLADTHHLVLHPLLNLLTLLIEVTMITVFN